MIATFTLKNPVCPEYICVAPSGIMCIDFHPRRPHMIAAGLVCGNVAVYNLQNKTHKPCYVSSCKSGKHADIVWQVKWCHQLCRNKSIRWFYYLIYKQAGFCNTFKFSNPKVKWAADTVEGYLNFYSASGDGKVINWTIVKTSLISATMMNIPFCERLENFNRVEAQKNWKGIVGNPMMHNIWKINILT